MKNYDKVVWDRSLSNTVSFGRDKNIPDRRDRVKYIEAIVKRAKLPSQTAKKHAQKNVARENVKLLFDVMFKDKKDDKTSKSQNVFSRLTATPATRNNKSGQSIPKTDKF